MACIRNGMFISFLFGVLGHSLLVSKKKKRKKEKTLDIKACA